jgi:mannose-6-phosphate isomerase
MANSDNVVRGGLTSKPVNLPQLRRVVSLDPERTEPMAATADGPGEASYDFAAEEFRLHRLELDGTGRDVRTSGPEILVCVDGGADLVAATAAAGVALPRGGSAFVPASVGAYTVRGVGTVFRVTVGHPR